MFFVSHLYLYTVIFLINFLNGLYVCQDKEDI